jgi:hypothetical protein
LRINVDAAGGTKAFEIYTNFHLDGDDYMLHIDKGYGSAGSMLKAVIEYEYVHFMHFPNSNSTVIQSYRRVVS